MPTRRTRCGCCPWGWGSMKAAGSRKPGRIRGRRAAAYMRWRYTGMRGASGGCSSCGRSMRRASSSVTARIGRKRWRCLRNLRELRAAGMACVCNAQNDLGSRGVLTSIGRHHVDVSWTSLWTSPWTSNGRHLWTSNAGGGDAVLTPA